MTAKRTAPASDPEQEYRSAMGDAIATHWAAVWKAIPAVIEGEDPEAVHKVRVASRRLRAAMDVATDCFPGKWYRPLHKTAKRITQALGGVRDRDVLLDALARERQRASDRERPGIDHLIAGIERDRKKARKAMIRFLTRLDDEGVRKETKRRFPRVKDARVVKGDTPGARHPEGGERGTSGKDTPPGGGPIETRRVSLPALDPKASLATNARRVLAVRIDELFRYGPIIPDAEASEALHDERISTKRLRYTLELFRSVFEDEGEQAIEQLKDLQEDLGVLHDHDVRIVLIEEELSALGTNGDEEAGELREGLGVLLQRERDTRATSHAAVVERWRRLEREQLPAKLRGLSVGPR